MKYTIIGTPKAIATCYKPDVEFQFAIKFKDDNAEFTYETTSMVYINRIDGWTDDDCDAVLYCVETECTKRFEE